ncbi:hypothetical protein LVD15_20470 [Fulvivirga maritima]|uniref:hypothetical protein n=1 Tax=Fulvivirga maritima TaxID=2904247 RepID=UPI001F29CCA9|nr:hypothetical protein [Fulvivirga maritima]UII25658.1 hypothetical protein LVD15_20470 [Fulvivirga maritima]
MTSFITYKSNIREELVFLIIAITMIILTEFAFKSFRSDQGYVAIVLFENSDHAQLSDLYTTVKKNINKASLSEYIYIKIENQTIYLIPNYKGLESYLLLVFNMSFSEIQNHTQHEKAIIYILDESAY